MYFQILNVTIATRFSKIFFYRKILHTIVNINCIAIQVIMIQYKSI